MSIDRLKARRDQLKEERRELKNRKSDVDKVIKKLDKKPPKDVDAVKKNAKKTADNLEDGIKGVKKIQALADDIRTLGGNAHGLDVWSEKTYLNGEIKRLSDKIDSLDRQIKQINDDIWDAREEALSEAWDELTDIF